VPARKSFLLRIQPELWEDLSRWAADELRSVNGHIEFLLREAVREKRRAGAARPRGDAARGHDPGSGPPHD
jgi:hypothetical protein